MSLKSAQSAKIGKMFQQKRLLMSFTLEEAAQKTYINIEYLKAIESGDYSVFPARMFALKYYEKYADFLDITQPFFDIFDKTIFDSFDEDNLEESFFEKNKRFIFDIGFIVLIIFFSDLLFIWSLFSQALSIIFSKELNSIMPLSIN